MRCRRTIVLPAQTCTDGELGAGLPLIAKVKEDLVLAESGKDVGISARDGVGIAQQETRELVGEGARRSSLCIERSRTCSKRKGAWRIADEKQGTFPMSKNSLR